VANRYPFVPEGGGWQEVLVDTPRHGVDLASMTREERVAALTLYRDRLAAAYERSPGAEVHLFRNQGRDAGSSRAHPHGQLVALEGATTPGRTQLEAAQCQAYAAGAPIIDRSVRGETDAEYHVARGLHLVAWVLHAPLDPGHLRIAPVERAASFSTASAGLLIELAELLGALAACLPGVAGTSDHNLLFHDHGNHPDDPALHWHLELRPRVSRLAGFEQMSATGVSSSDPARDAALLRGAMPFEFRP
jgi:UDPglucose--hexose-1-phosphate uridylyltransferase